MIDLDLLRAFLAIFRLGSVTKAAETLALSQSAVSGRLQALEVKLGKALFIRDRRGVRPTSHARALARVVAPHVDGLEAIFEGFRDRSNAISGTIRIAGPWEFIESFVVPALDLMIGLGVRPEFSSGSADGRLDALAAGDLDLAILTTGAGNPATATARLYLEHFVLIAAPRWADALREDAETAIREGQVPMLIYSHSLPIMRRYWGEVFDREPSFQAALVLPDLRALVTAAVAGAGATVVPDYLCRTELVAGQLILHAPKIPAPSNAIELAWRVGGRQPPRNLIVRDLLLRVVAT